MICFFGTTHAAQHLKAAAIIKGLEVTNDPYLAKLVFVSEDTPTNAEGVRDLDSITWLVRYAAGFGHPLVLTSQVTPGFTRSLGIEKIWHQAETLRIKDAAERALNPEYIAVGGEALLPMAYALYLAAFKCPILRMSWEEAEFSKIAINTFLAAQVETTNKLVAVAEKVGADWDKVKETLQHDKRIGPNAYLEPGRWQDSKHLLRDHVTLEALK